MLFVVACNYFWRFGCRLLKDDDSFFDVPPRDYARESEQLYGVAAKDNAAQNQRHHRAMNAEIVTFTQPPTRPQ